LPPRAAEPGQRGEVAAGGELGQDLLGLLGGRDEDVAHVRLLRLAALGLERGPDVGVGHLDLVGDRLLQGLLDETGAEQATDVLDGEAELLDLLLEGREVLLVGGLRVLGGGGGLQLEAVLHGLVVDLDATVGGNLLEHLELDQGRQRLALDLVDAAEPLGAGEGRDARLGARDLALDEDLEVGGGDALAVDGGRDAGGRAAGREQQGAGGDEGDGGTDAGAHR
jgi:hypothetical protein